MLRRKKRIDAIDREILRLMRGSRRGISGNQIARRVNLSAPAIRPRLNNLQHQGIVKQILTGRNRLIHSNLSVPSKILWNIDLKPEPRKKKKSHTHITHKKS